MSKIFRSAMRLNKTKYSFQLSVSIKTLRLHPMHNDKEIMVSLTKGGSKSVSSEHPRKPGGAWNETLSLGTTLYRDSHGRYQEKKFLLVVKHSGTGKTLATFKFDASRFASAAGTKEACEFQSINPKDDGRIRVEVTCVFLRQLDTQESEISSVVSSVVGDDVDDGREDEQDLSGWSLGGAFESGAGESFASTAAIMLPESSPLSPPSSATTDTTPTFSSPSSMQPPPVTVVGMGHMPSFRRSTDLRPPRHNQSPRTKPQVSSSSSETDATTPVQGKENLRKRLARLEETHRIVLTQKQAVEEQLQVLRTEFQRDQQLQYRQATEKEETMRAMQQRLVELGEHVRDRDGELVCAQEVLTEKEAEISVARERETRLKAQVQEVEKGREKLLRAKEEREAAFEKAKRAAAADVERLQNELFILKESITSPPKLQYTPQELQQEQESDDTREASPEVATMAATAAAAAAAATAKAKETNGVVMAKLKALEEERLALLHDKAELTDGLKETKATLDEARVRHTQMEKEQAALALRLAEMEEQEQRRQTQCAETQREKCKGEIEGLRTQVKCLEKECRVATERTSAAEATAAKIAEAEVRLAAQLGQEQEQLAATVDKQSEHVQALLAQRGQWEMEKEGLTVRVAELVSSLKIEKQEAENALQSLKQAKETVATNAAEAAAVLVEKERIIVQLLTMEAEKTCLLKEIDEERQHWVAEAQGHEKQRLEWTSKKEEMLARMGELEAALEAAREEVKEGRRCAAVKLEEREAAWVMEKQDMATRLLVVEGDKTRLKTTLEEEMQRRLDKVKEEEVGLAEWMEERQALLLTVAELKGDVASSSEEAAALREEARDAWRSLTLAKEEVEAHAAAERELERSLQLMQTQVIHVEGNVRAEREAREEADSEAAGAMDRLRALEGEMGEVVEERNTYQEGLVDAKLKIAQLSEELDSLSFQLQHYRMGK